MRVSRVAGVVAVAVAAAVLGVPSAGAVAAAPPPPHAGFDYQIGGGYTPPAGVTVVTRDRGDTPAAGDYNVCYVNAYQTQPAETDWWRTNHDDLLLKDANGNEVVDSNWGEVLLDVSTAAKRSALADIVGGWIDGCAASGFAAVEPDNLDSHTRSGGLLTESDALALADLLVARAHADRLAIGQKNAAGTAARGRAAGFDFAVAEQCADYGECGKYVSAYGDEVLVIEYSASGLSAACANWGGRLSIVRRDMNVSRPGDSGYVYGTC